MKKRVLALILAGAMAVSACLVLASCDKDNGGGSVAGSTREEYALSLVSSISYLSDGDRASNAARTSFVKPVAASRPEYIGDGDVAKIEELIGLFGNIIAEGGINEEVKENTSTDPVFSEYKLVMTVSLHDMAGERALYTLYFNETGKKTEKEIEAGVEEIEESTRFEGVAIFGGELFVIKGEREVETEGAETEVSLEFRTYKNIGGDVPKADGKNYVEVEKSSESGELEYEYTFVKDGKVVREIELEYEESRGGAEISFESESSGGELSFEIKKSKNGGFEVELEKNGKKEIITVTEEQGGSYKLVYPNGFEEFVNKT